MTSRAQLIAAGVIKPDPVSCTKPLTVADLARQRGVSLSQVRRERAAALAPQALAALKARQKTRETLAAITQRLQTRSVANAILQALNAAIRSRA